MKPLIPSVRRVKWKHHGERASWLVQGFKEMGKTVRLFFSTHALAEEEIARRRQDRQKYGTAADSFSQQDRLDLAKAKEILAPYGKNVVEAADFTATYLQRTAKSCTVDELRLAMLKAKERDGRGQRYLQDLRSRLGRFCEDYAETKVAAITGTEVDDWLRALPLSPVSRNNFRRVLHALFAYAIVRGFRPDNPMTATAKAKVVLKAPEIFTPAELRTLLAKAAPAIVPALAIGAFAGLRRAEIDRLDWSEVDLAAGYIEVTSDKAKTAQRRLVKILPNLAAWLTPHALKTGPVRASKEKEQLTVARKAAKLKSWPDNGLRHSFASYHLAHYGDAKALALELGHTGPDLLFAHYREVVRPDAAALWWQIMPEADAGKVVRFAQDAKKPRAARRS